MGTRSERERKRKVNIWIILAILIPSIIAGARDEAIGTDTLTYGIPLFRTANNRNFMEYMMAGGAEPLYMIFVYLVAIFTNDVFWELFIIEFVCLLFTYKGLKSAGLKQYVWIGFLVYHLMYYSFSLNLMRQFMCLSILLYAFKFVRNSDFKKYFIIVILLCFIQRTSIVGVFIYPIYHICYTDSIKNGVIRRFATKYRVLFEIFIILSTCLVISLSSFLIKDISSLLPNYAVHMSNMMNTNHRIIWRNVYYMVAIIIPLFLYKNILTHVDGNFEFYFIMLIVSAILWQLQGVSTEVYRISFYFGYYIILAVPTIISKGKRFLDKVLIFTYYLVIMLLYNYDYFVIHLYNQTYPYTSKLLGI